MARKIGAGKLRRVTIAPEGPRQNLARQRNLYDIELSPEKGNYTLPEKVNHKPLKVARKKNKPGEERSHVSPLPSGLPASDVNDLRSSPPRVPQAGSDTLVVDDTGKSTDKAAQPVTREHVEIEDTLPNGKLRCTAVPYKYDKQLGARYQQCLRPGDSITDVGPRCGTHMDKPDAVQCGALVVEGVCATRCLRIATLETVNGARCPTHVASLEPQTEAHPHPLRWRKPTVLDSDHRPSQATTKRKAGPDHIDERPSKLQRSQRQKGDASVPSTRTQPQVRIAAQKSTEQPAAGEHTGDEDDVPDAAHLEEEDLVPVEKPTRSRKQGTDDGQSTHQDTSARKRKTKKAEDPEKQAAAEEAASQDSEGARSHTEAEHPDIIQAEKSDPAPVGKHTRSAREASKNNQCTHQQRPTNKANAKKASKRPREATVEEASTEEPENEESDADANESVPDEDPEETVETPGTVNAVFKFLDLEKRPGKCKTKLGSAIRRLCKRSCAQFQGEDVTMETVMEDFDDVRERLNQIGSRVEEDDRRAFKGDAYGYIFRGLTQYLQALYRWLDESYGTVTESLDAMRVLSLIIHAILAFKDAITKWDASVPRRYKGDRIIKDVDTGLITHLRQVGKTFNIRLSRLEAEEQSRIQHEKCMRRMNEGDEEERQRKEAAESRKKRWTRWQELHIARLQCEPNVHRRQQLAITRLEVLGEKDANGVTFERLAVFKARSTPPQHRSSALSEGREWTDDQESALLNGLKEFSGMSRAVRVAYT
jgi:hypothetical protein